MADPVETRDIAVSANTKVDQHIADCTELRKTIASTFSELRNDIKNLNWKMGMIFGGITLISKVMEHLFK